MIKSIVYQGLHKKLAGRINFHSDFSLLTGRNGSGKTALIKLLWYMVSGNIERTLREVHFTFVEVVTDTCTVSIWCEGYDPESKVQAKLYLVKEDEYHEVMSTRNDWDSHGHEIDQLNTRVARATGSSLFFPTFRRIEGGFATTTSLLDKREEMQFFNSIESALQEFASRLSVSNHKFMVSISTRDLLVFLTEKYAEESHKVSVSQRRMYDSLKEEIRYVRSFKEGSLAPDQYKVAFNNMSKLIEFSEAERKQWLERFERLETAVTEVFSHGGIKLTSTLVFGDPKQAVESDLLSAGEKQLLSFLSYNVFVSNSVIIIDEPEISLHPDWQRRLIYLLKSQNTTNQFIFTTHSPFIYAKYPEKEIVLNDKGE